MANQPVYTISYSQGSEEIKKVNCFNAKERNETLKLIKDLNATLKGIEQIQIKEFNSIRECANELNLLESLIGKVLSKERKHTKGFYFEYK